MAGGTWLDDPSRNVPGEYPTPRVEVLPATRLPHGAYRRRTPSNQEIVDWTAAQLDDDHWREAPEITHLKKPASLRTTAVWSFGFISLVYLAMSVLMLRLIAGVARVRDGTAAAGDIEPLGDLIGQLAFAAFGLTTIASVMLALWQWRCGKNALCCGRAPGSRPLLAAFGWFIPLAAFFLPWSHMERVADRPQVSGLGAWRAMFVGVALMNWLSPSAFAISRVDVDDSLTWPRVAAGTMLACAILMAGATLFAGVAMKEIESLSVRPPRQRSMQGDVLPRSVWAPATGFDAPDQAMAAKVPSARRVSRRDPGRSGRSPARAVGS
jgi:hypothetical protein